MQSRPTSTKNNIKTKLIKNVSINIKSPQPTKKNARKEQSKDGPKPFSNIENVSTSELSNDVSPSRSTEANIQVVVRVRPI